MSNISVVIPYYNDSKSIERCLKSVFEQSYLPREIIIIDDCSMDDNILEEILSKFDTLVIEICLYRNDVNRNGAYSRNRGVKAAKGKFIALLDADDYWLPDHLYKCFEEIKDGSSDFLYSNVITQMSSGTKYLRKCSNVEEYSNPYDSLLDSPPQTGSFFFKRSLFEFVQFDETLRRHQDYQFLFDLIDNKIRIKYVDSYTSVYCESPRDLSSRLNFNDIIRFWECRKSYFSKLKLDRKILEIMLICISVDKKCFLNLAKEGGVFDFYLEKFFLRFIIESDYIPYFIKKIIVKVFYLKDFSFLSKVFR